MESGTVNVTLKDPDTLSEQSEALAIFEGNMEMSGGSMTLKASNATDWSYGLIISEGNLTITNGTLDVTAGSGSDQIRPENSSSTGDASHPILWALMIAFACFAVMFSKKRVHA